jgi:hypothetical protein
MTSKKQFRSVGDVQRKHRVQPEGAKTWKPVNPAVVKLSIAQLCKPVDLSGETSRR